jgi:HlyD family secretion protein
MKITRRHVMSAAIVLTLLALAAWFFRPDPVAVERARVTRGALQVTVDEDGRTRIKERYVVSAPVAGQLRRIELHPGDPVIAGQTVVAKIEPVAPELLDARTRSALAARVRAAEGQVQLADPRIERMRAVRELADAELTRALTLSDQKAISLQELDRAREAARAAAEDLRAADYSRQIAGFELEQARAALSRSSLEGQTGEPAWELAIAAPVSGRVLRVFHEDAGVVGSGTPLVEIGDPAQLEAEVDVLSSDAARIEPGARVYFEHWGGGTPLEGRVRIVEPAGFLKISALGVEEQRVNIIADFTTPLDERRTLGDAYRVEARIVVWKADDVLKLPVGALFRSDGRWTVFAVRDDRAWLTPVEVGQSNGRETELLGGLAEGDEVIVHPSDKVADGVAVTVRKRR